uniref:Uncharacterized protein n=1 Tax=Arundo donax TaxID=35708 RepID=A0A0A9DSH2_ARUDO
MTQGCDRNEDFYWKIAAKQVANHDDIQDHHSEAHQNLYEFHWRHLNHDGKFHSNDQQIHHFHYEKI